LTAHGAPRREGSQQWNSETKHLQETDLLDEGELPAREQWDFCEVVFQTERSAGFQI
jgi:hypothetical protein